MKLQSVSNIWAVHHSMYYIQQWSSNWQIHHSSHVKHTLRVHLKRGQLVGLTVGLTALQTSMVRQACLPACNAFVHWTAVPFTARSRLSCVLQLLCCCFLVLLLSFSIVVLEIIMIVTSAWLKVVTYWLWRLRLPADFVWIWTSPQQPIPSCMFSSFLVLFLSVFWSGKLDFVGVCDLFGWPNSFSDRCSLFLFWHLCLRFSLDRSPFLSV